jgi:hypothetical protein
MHKKITFYAAILLLLAGGACKKDSGSANALSGEWKFVSMHVKAQSTAQYTDNGVVNKSITLSDYTTTDNAGVVSITSSTMSAKGLTYSVSTTSTATIYQDGLLVETDDVPFTFTLPATNSVSNYKLVGADSLYFPNGGFASGGGTVTQSAASGAKFTISGNTMTMISNGTQTKTESYAGEIITTTDQAVATTTLQKQ